MFAIAVLKEGYRKYLTRYAGSLTNMAPDRGSLQGDIDFPDLIDLARLIAGSEMTKPPSGRTGSFIFSPMKPIPLFGVSSEKYMIFQG